MTFRLMLSSDGQETVSRACLDQSTTSSRHIVKTPKVAAKDGVHDREKGGRGVGTGC